MAAGGIGRKLMWFAGLWIAGVATVALVGLIIRFALGA
ncbi:hypothetical protein J2Y48_000173 [Mycoplana sp. BE70]|nr:hypothetical protein [Mycoplana sp. BE70]